MPNRWLVMRRSFVTSSGVKRDTCQWLLRSDTAYASTLTGARKEPDTAPAALVPVATSPGGYPGMAPCGTVFPVVAGNTIQAEPHQWNDAGNSPLFLTVNSTGLPEFCSYQPYNQNILSFHDLHTDLTQTQSDPARLNAGSQEITVNYLVMGWYSHGKSDLVRADTVNLRDTLKAYGWELQGTEDFSVSGTVYFGTVLGIPWSSAETNLSNYQPSCGGTPFSLDARPQPAEVRLAAGQSSVEACTAVVARANLLTDAEARYFSAFQSNLLDTRANPGVPDHTAEIDVLHALQYGQHATSFISTQGGAHWQLTTDAGASPSPDSAQAQSMAEVTRDVNDLNARQALYEGVDRKIRDLTTRLKGLWWSSMPYKTNLSGIPTPPKDADVQSVNTLVTELEEALKDRTAHIIDIESKRKGIEEKLAAGTFPWVLQPMPLPPFQQAGDPVIVMMNLQAPRSQRTDELDGYLSGPLEIGRQTVLDSEPSSLPTQLKSLLTPPAFSCFEVLTKGFESALDGVVAGLGSKDVNCATVRGRGGTGSINVPDSSAPVNPFRRWWNQPWKPVFLEWAADLYPSLLKAEQRPTDYPYGFTAVDPGEKSLLAAGDIPQYFHTDLHTQNPRSIPEDSIRQLTGCFTTAHPLLEDHTRYRLRHAADLARSQDARTAYLELDKQIGDHSWNLTSATLTGVNSACAGRKPDVPLPTHPCSTDRPPFTYEPPKAADKFATPKPEVVTAPVPHLPLTVGKAIGDGHLPPVRSGQLRLRTLKIHDAFGRLLNLNPDVLHVAAPMRVHQNSTPAVDTRTYTHTGATTDPGNLINPAGLFDLRPRLHQGARLRYDYLTTGADRTPLCDLPDPSTANPVHGWLMATRAGRRHALLCYDPHGTPLYDLHCLSATNPATARPLPGCPYTEKPLALGGQFSKDHPTLYAFLKPLLDDGNSKGHLAALLSTLELSLPATAPPSADGPDTHGLALLIGRPIALATARLRLELDGPPLRDPKDLAADEPPAHIEKWPVALGSPHLYTDGLLGYYTDTAFTTLHTHHPTGLTPPYTTQATPSDITLTPQDPAQSDTSDTHVTLLITPHHATYATTDILPASSLNLPPHTLDHLLTAIRPTIPLGPILTPPPQPAGPYVQTPTPTYGATAGTWQWTEPTAPGTWTEPVPAASPTTQAVTPTTLARSGYLQLTGRKQE
ncbi:hypothetical protein ABZ611_31305 [Streptomyces sp. NPDC007861]|uniref:hypothetical protein n=1 Tax=Streptomyces sp. NPDC007861 TaxID=3154893 RepID=UPI0033C12C63